MTRGGILAMSISKQVMDLFHSAVDSLSRYAFEETWPTRELDFQGTENQSMIKKRSLSK